MPAGAPALAFYKEAADDNFMTNSVPANIIAMMNDDGPDIVVIDTLSGLKAINNGVDYLLAANLTFGNFYLAATGHDDDGVMDSDDVIVLFGEKQNPDLLFHYLYGEQFDDNLEYVANVQDAAKCLIMGENLLTDRKTDYVLLAQPALSAALRKNADAYVYADIQSLYQEKCGEEMIQASIFVNKNSDKKLVSAYLDKLAADIDVLLSDAEVLYAVDLGREEFASVYGIDVDTAVEVLRDNNGLGLGFTWAYENRAAIADFCSLFGFTEINDEVYFK